MQVSIKLEGADRNCSSTHPFGLEDQDASARRLARSLVSHWLPTSEISKRLRNGPPMMTSGSTILRRLSSTTTSVVTRKRFPLVV